MLDFLLNTAQSQARQSQFDELKGTLEALPAGRFRECETDTVVRNGACYFLSEIAVEFEGGSLRAFKVRESRSPSVGPHYFEPGYAYNRYGFVQVENGQEEVLKLSDKQTRELWDVCAGRIDKQKEENGRFVAQVMADFAAARMDELDWNCRVANPVEMHYEFACIYQGVDFTLSSEKRGILLWKYVHYELKASYDDGMVKVNRSDSGEKVAQLFKGVVDHVF